MIDLPRTLSGLNAVAMVAGTIIGASIFVQPAEIARTLDTPGQIMLVWLACGLLTLCGALVCAELSSAFPQTAGLYVFLRESFSPLAGFLWGWAMFWSMHSGMRLALEFAGPDRLLAGSDYPHQIGSIPLMLDAIERLEVDDEVKRKIAGGNAARLLALD